MNLVWTDLGSSLSSFALQGGCMDDAGVLALVNQIRKQLAGFARTIVTDFADNK